MKLHKMRTAFVSLLNHFTVQDITNVISQVTDHTDTTFQKQSVFLRRCVKNLRQSNWLFNSTIKFFNTGITCKISLMCFRTIYIVTDHTGTTFQKQSVFFLRCSVAQVFSTRKDENRLFLKRCVCVICDDRNSLKTH
jgi:hypothetical protein